MNDTERYLFDLQGFIHLPNFLPQEQAASLLRASKQLEADAWAVRNNFKHFRGMYNLEYWQHPQDLYFAGGSTDRGQTLMVEDFWLHHSGSFDFLIGHEKSLAYAKQLVQGPIAINNSELRIRYPQNHTGIHMGFPHGHVPKYRYDVLNNQIQCTMIRFIYFLHDVGPNDGVTCFVPGSHKSKFEPPQTPDIEKEPGIVGFPVKAGDVILFSEACRHGGFPNRSETTRYTLHVGYGPDFLQSQNLSTMDEHQNTTPALLSRISEEQRNLLIVQKRKPI